MKDRPDWTSIRVRKTTASVLKSMGRKNYDAAIRDLLELGHPDPSLNGQNRVKIAHPPIPPDAPDDFRWARVAGPLVVFLSSLGKAGERWVRIQSAEPQIEDLAVDLHPEWAVDLIRALRWALEQQGDTHEKRN